MEKINIIKPPTRSSNSKERTTVKAQIRRRIRKRRGYSLLRELLLLFATTTLIMLPLILKTQKQILSTIIGGRGVVVSAFTTTTITIPTKKRSFVMKRRSSSRQRIPNNLLLLNNANMMESSPSSSSSSSPFSSETLLSSSYSSSTTSLLSSSSYNSNSNSISSSEEKTNNNKNNDDGDLGDVNGSNGLILPSFPNLSIKSVMAPMVAASDYPFRYFLRNYCNVDLCFTQMLHSKNFVYDKKFRQSHLDLYECNVQQYYEDKKLTPTQIDCLGNLPIPTNNGPNQNHHQQQPVIVQIAGNDVNLALKQAEMLLEYTNGNLHGIDLNCGCPQGIARKGNYGAFLMDRDEDQVCTILKALRDYLPTKTTVSAKIRLPLDNTMLQQRICKLVETTGIDFLTIHGRTIKENKTKVGPCHIDRIKNAIEIAHSIKPNFPIIANGGMEDYNDFQMILKQTGAVAGMSSESLLETPNIFMKPSSSQTTLTPRQLFNQQFGFAYNYLNVCAEICPPLPGVLGMARNKGGSFSMIRGHLLKFLHRYLMEHDDIRDKFTKSSTLRTIVDARQLVNELESRYSNLDDDEFELLQSSSLQSSWYRRHRKPDRHVHQREIFQVGSTDISGLQDGGADTTTTAKEEAVLLVEERKQQIRERLQKLKSQRQQQQQQTKTKNNKVTRFL